MSSILDSLTKQDVSDISRNFEYEFGKIRKCCIFNTVNKEFSRPEKKLDQEKIQAKINDNILIFKDPRVDLPKKTFHNII